MNTIKNLITETRHVFTGATVIVQNPMRKNLSLAQKKGERSLAQSAHGLPHLQRIHTFIATPFRDRGACFGLELKERRRRELIKGVRGNAPWEYH